LSLFLFYFFLIPPLPPKSGVSSSQGWEVQTLSLDMAGLQKIQIFYHCPVFGFFDHKYVQTHCAELFLLSEFGDCFYFWGEGGCYSFLLHTALSCQATFFSAIQYRPRIK
jgi:hypothetical protein